MPVEFLSDDQAARYGHYCGDPTPAQLARYFFLDDADLARIRQHRGAYQRLGFALQLGTVRFLGTFLTDPTTVPAIVARHLADQLGITDFTVLPRYLERKATRYAHAREIQQTYGYREFTDQPEHFRLVRWLYLRAWLSDERPSVLFDLTTARLIERKILLPGVTVLARLVAQVREKVTNRLWRVLYHAVTPAQQMRLEDLLTIPPNARLTVLEQLRRTAQGVNSVGMVKALKRLEAVRVLDLERVNLHTVPPARLAALARTAILTDASRIARMPEQRRIATLLAYARAAETLAQDDALDLLDTLLMNLVRQATRTAQQIRLRTLKDLDAAALHLSTVCTYLINPAYADAEIRTTIYAAIPQETITAAVETIEALARPSDVDIQPELITRYTLVRRFLPTLLRTIAFQGTAAGRPVLTALAFLQRIEGMRDPDLRQAPREVVPRPWQRFVFLPRHEVDRPAYTLCVLEQLQMHLRRHDVFVTPSDRWGDLRTTLLQGADWEAQRTNVCRVLNLPTAPAEAVEGLRHTLDAAFRRVAAHLPSNTAVRIETVDGKNRLHVDRLDKLDQPPSLIQLNQRTSRLMPQVDLAEALLEVHARTGFADDFTPIGGATARMADLPISVCAVLLAAACNIGLEPLIRPDVPALTRRRLDWVLHSCIRAETLTQANARLVDAQASIPLVQVWGNGAVASADGIRFVVPVRTVNAGPNPTHFGAERGVTYLNFMSDQFSGFYGLVVPGTIRDSPYILDGLLEHQTSLSPTELMTDTAGYSDLVFGLFWLLGYRFSPRLADAGGARMWRIDRTADYGVLNSVATSMISTKLIATHWDDLLRVAGSVKLKTVRPSTLLRALQAAQHTSTLARALAEVGRLAKTLFLLAYIDDENYRRRVLTQLNRGEERHRLARELFYGKRGELRQSYREGQEDQLGALGLVLNVLVLWNTWYLDQALRHLRRGGVVVDDADIARLWPLSSAHLNMVGHYTFVVPELIVQGAFRPLTVAADQDESAA